MSDDRVFLKCAWRLIPFMMALYVFNILDRVNVGFAALSMNADLGFSPAIYGFAAGIFFISYALCQVPANVILERAGARRSVFCIMLAWGAISSANAFVQTPMQFYVLRFLLGVAEAGFFPGMILYLSIWFPQAYRARFTAIFMTASPFASLMGGPLSGIVLGLNGVAGLHGWQWLFVIEGLPACLLGFAALRFLPDNPMNAPWLSGEEKAEIEKRLMPDAPAVASSPWPGISDARVLLLGAAGIGAGAANFGSILWLPQIVQAMGYSNLEVGFIVTLPNLAGIAAMILVGRSSDRRNERIWHTAIPWLISAAGFAAVSTGWNNVLGIGALIVAMAGFIAVFGPYYSLSSSFQRGPAGAASIALVNVLSVGIGGFLGPNVVGMLKEQTGGYAAGLLALAAALVVSAVIVLALGRVTASRSRLAQVRAGAAP